MMKNEKDWIKLKERAGAPLADAVKKLYSLYGEDMLDWFAEVYDPGTGGFYASVSGRDGVSFGPDIQCTAQALKFMVNSGLTRDAGADLKEVLPEDMQHRLIYFTKSLQDPENGYFYHKQWGREGTDSKLSRRGRDLSFATVVFTELGSAPTYDTPNGLKGDGITADQYWDSLCTDAPRPYTYDKSPVELIKATAELAAKSAAEELEFKETLRHAIETAPKAAGSGKDTTAYLKSHTGYIKYLLDRVEPGIHKNPYQMGNETGAVSGELKINSEKLGPYKFKEEDGEECKQFDGLKLCEMLLLVLRRSINPKTGIWGDLTPEAPLGSEFKYINGFFKTVGRFTDFGTYYPPEYSPLAAEKIMACLLGDEPSTSNVCEIFNIWSTVYFLKENIALIPNEGTRVESLAYIEGVLKENAPAAILNTYEKLKGYKKIDGGMAHNYKCGTTAHQCLPVSPSGNLSDMDGTCCGCTGAVRNMFAALGLEDYKPPIFDLEDWRDLYKKLSEKKPVVKKKYV